LQAIGDYFYRALQAAKASGDPRREAQARRDLTTAEAAIKENNDALNAVAENTASLVTAMAGVQAELKRQTDFASSVQATDGFQLKKYLAELLGGQVVQGAIGRSFTPGSGVEYAY
jgi:hypothetical protein